MSELTDQLDSDTRTACLYEAKDLAELSMAQNKIALIEHKLYDLALQKEDYKLALEHFKSYHEHSARSDVKNLLSKLEIMSIEQDFRMDNPVELNLQDFANMDIFSDYNVEDIIESLGKDLQYKAHTDDLTGLPNRRRINEKLKNIIMPQVPMTHGLLIIDIDHFKMINDNEGHLYGDRCLIRVSKALKDWAEAEGHFVGRYGGEEFLCILENLTEKEVKVQAETIRQKIEQENMPYNVHHETHHLTISVGGAMIHSTKEESVYKTLEKADQALYKAKSSGRNCVRMDRG
jgi:diguanylate cyclase (GGDEF)-like protein